MQASHQRHKLPYQEVDMRRSVLGVLSAGTHPEPISLVLPAAVKCWDILVACLCW